MLSTPDYVPTLKTPTKLSGPLYTRRMLLNGHCNGATLSFAQELVTRFEIENIEDAKNH